MVGVCAAVLGITNLLLYRHDVEQHREMLQVTAQSQARLIEAVASFDAEMSHAVRDTAVSYDAYESTLSQIIDGHSRFVGFGRTGEFTLARREDDQISFVLRHRHDTLEHPAPVPFGSDLAEPMRRALDGSSGTVIGLDYRGETVLAAHEPVAVLDLGIVAKIDLAEIRAPFIRSGLLTAVVSLFVVLASTALFFRIGNPILERLEMQAEALRAEIVHRRRGEEKLRAFMESATEGFIVLDEKLALVSVNETALGMLPPGHAAECLPDQPVLELPPPLGAARWVEEYRRVLQTGDHVHFEDFVVDPRTEPRHLSVRIFRVGSGLGIITTDLTEKVKAEAALRETEAQLVQSQKMEAIGRLAGGVAHDLNNLLTGITGYTSLMNVSIGREDRWHGTTEEILRICARASDLTKNLLGFARKGKFRKERIDIRESVREVTDILGPSLSKKVTIETRLPENLSSVEGDSGQLNQILMNLCINAADAMGDEGMLIVAAEDAVVEMGGRGQPVGLGPGPWIKLSVTDTGEGMSEEVMARAFDPFFTTRPQGEGTGLGLSMVYGAVKNHGGAVTLDSEPGRGTEVTVWLPALEPVHGSPPPVRTSSQALTKGEGTVLLVDDEETVRAVTAQLLQRLGYQVIRAQHGGEALEIYRERAAEIDLVLLDMSMPVMDGPETFENLRTINAEVRVVLYSGYSADAAAARLISDGARGFVQKPYAPGELADALSKAIAT